MTEGEVENEVNNLGHKQSRLSQLLNRMNYVNGKVDI